MARIIPVLLLIFKVWLLVDVHKKRMPQYWYFIIFFVPFGDVVYFVMHKLKDFKIGKMLKSPPSLAETEYRYQATPSINNRVIFAKALYDAGKCEDACWHFDGVLTEDAHNEDALYGKAICLIDQKRYQEGIALLTQLVSAQPSWHDYTAWLDLAKAQWEFGLRDESVDTLQRLVKTRSRTDHQAALAQCLMECGRHAEANDVINKALAEYDHSPPHTRRLYRSSARILRSLKNR